MSTTAQKLVILRQRRRRNHKGNGGNLFLRLLLGLALVATLSVLLTIGTGVGMVAGVYAYYAKDLPDPQTIESVEEEFETTKFFDRTGQTVIYEVVNPQGDRTWVSLDQIPEHVINATVAIEDRNYWENPGINVRGLARAFISNLRGGQVQGGSSITQQLIKKVLIPPEEREVKSYARKIKEVILALEITRRYSKEQILEWYLNRIFYGHLAYGIEAASQVYFGKHVSDLDVAEAAMLAALPQYPGLNPIDNWDKAKERQRLVIDAMLRQGYITQEEAIAAKMEKLTLKRGVEERYDVIAPHFSLYALDRLEEIVPPEQILRGGLRVYTTIDLEMQAKAEEIARAHIAKLEEEGRNAHNAAVVSLNVRTGEILVMMGSLDYWNKEIDGEVNVALANRQPGSSFKPFNYVTAFAQGYTPATMIMDVRTCFPQDPPNPPYCPENYDRKYHGPETFRTALQRSRNICAVKVLDLAGVANVIKTAHRMGITTLREDMDYYGLSLTLGGGEVKLLDMAYAYSVFANGGAMVGAPVPESRQETGYRELDPVAILRVEDRDGNILWEYKEPERKQVLSPQLAYLMCNVLSDNNARLAAFGVNNPLHLEDRPVAAKTGTTDDFRDAWTIGFTPQLVTGVWVGNSDNEPMKHVPGSKGAGPIWHDFMEWATKDMPAEQFVRPPGIEEHIVCAISGLLPNEHCPHKVREVFIAGTAPTAVCNVHQAFQINRETGKLATVYTPPELVETRVYEIYPPEAADWVREAGIPQPPTEYDTIYGPSPESEDVAILKPAPYAYISQGTVIEGNARGGNFAFYRLEYGPGLNPSSWTQLGGDHPYEVSNGPLEYWDVSQLDGLYTLQLRVVGHDGSVRDDAIQVTVDNISPTVSIGYPLEGDLYVMEDDEWVNIQADARDNVSMDRVEFFVDNQPIGVTMVPPFNKRWMITMSDTLPLPTPMVITRTEPITNPLDGSIVGEQVITVTEVITGEGGLIQQWWENGFGVMYYITDTKHFTESHLIHVVAYDAAGNRTESERVRIYVVHEDKEEKEKSTGFVAWRDDEVAFIGDERRGWAGG